MRAPDRKKRTIGEAPKRYRFGRLTLDTGRRRLSSGKRAIRLGRLTFDLLQALVEAAPNVVSHEDLAKRVWAGRPVTSETLSQRVKLLRDALDDHADHPRYVEVIRGHGHRLIPRVHVLPNRSFWPHDLRSPAFLAVPATLATIAAIAVFWSWSPNTSYAPPPSIAVVPFAPRPTGVSGLELGEQIAERVIGQLSSMQTLRVFPSSATFPFRSNIGELHETEAGLGASHVLKGTLQQEGGTMTLSAQLIECATGYQVWSGAQSELDDDPETAISALASFVATGLEERLSLPDPGRPVDEPDSMVAYAIDVD